jgi:hypothetical protein
MLILFHLPVFFYILFIEQCVVVLEVVIFLHLCLHCVFQLFNPLLQLQIQLLFELLCVLLGCLQLSLALSVVVPQLSYCLFTLVQIILHLFVVSICPLQQVGIFLLSFVVVYLSFP